MHSAFICLVLLGLLALASGFWFPPAKQEQHLAHHLAKKAVISTRQLTPTCTNAVEMCYGTFQAYAGSLSQTDPQLQSKICGAARTFYDCFKSALSPCQNTHTTQVLSDLLTKLKALCPTEFQGATLL
jgi:hypothetical protein